MHILLTGAFGNLGSHTIPELLAQGHQVRTFDLPTPANRRAAARYGERIETRWGDLCDPIAVRGALRGPAQCCQAIIHLAAVIPPLSDEDPELAQRVNVDGTRHLLEAAQALEPQPHFLFASTFDLFGPTTHLAPPRRLSDPVMASDPYTTHKLAGEQMVQASGLTWLIMRFADMPQIALRAAHPLMYRIPPETRIEALHPADGGLALTNALKTEAVWGQILLVGGGSSCQVTYRDYLARLLTAMGIGPLPDEAFSHEPYWTDWLDSAESQRWLQYQRHSFDDMVNEIAALLGWRKLFVPLARPFVRRRILSLSPYYKPARKA
jgi:nucleoside-diphosphate-sugar epimerase